MKATRVQVRLRSNVLRGRIGVMLSVHSLVRILDGVSTCGAYFVCEMILDVRYVRTCCWRERIALLEMQSQAQD